MIALTDKHLFVLYNQLTTWMLKLSKLISHISKMRINSSNFSSTFKTVFFSSPWSPPSFNGAVILTNMSSIVVFDTKRENQVISVNPNQCTGWITWCLHMEDSSNQSARKVCDFLWSLSQNRPYITVFVTFLGYTYVIKHDMRLQYIKVKLFNMLVHCI